MLFTHTHRAQLAQHSKLIALQQTRCQPFDRESLHNIVPRYKVYYNNYRRQDDLWLALKQRENSNPTASAGTAILIHPDLIELYHVSHHVLIQGHVHRLDFEPRRGTEGDPFSFYNVYLYTGSGNDVRVRQKQIAHLCSFPKKQRSIFAGDWNFTLDPGDTTGLPCTDAAFLEEWESFIAHYQLTELSQPTHTRFEWNGTRSSRIDRVYWNYPEAIWTVVAPKVFLPPVAFDVHNTLQNGKIELAKQINKG